MTTQELRDLERRLEMLLCAITARLHPPLEHPLTPTAQAAYDAQLDVRIRDGLRDLRENVV